MLMVEPTMVIIFWACSPISFGYTFLDPTFNHIPLKSRCLKVETELGMSTLFSFWFAKRSTYLIDMGNV